MFKPDANSDGVVDKANAITVANDVVLFRKMIKIYHRNSFERYNLPDCQMICSAPTLFKPACGLTKNNITLPIKVTVTNVIEKMIRIGFQFGFMEIISHTLRINNGIRILTSNVEMTAIVITRSRNTLVKPLSLWKNVGPGV